MSTWSSVDGLVACDCVHRLNFHCPTTARGRFGYDGDRATMSGRYSLYSDFGPILIHWSIRPFGIG